MVLSNQDNVKLLDQLKSGFKGRRLYPICQAKRQNDAFGSNHP